LLRGSSRWRLRVARGGKGISTDAEGDPPHLARQPSKRAPSCGAVHGDERRLELFGQGREAGATLSLARRGQRRGLASAGLEQARQDGANGGLGVAGRALAARFDEGDGAFLAHEDAAWIDIAARGIGVLRDLENEVAGQLGGQRNAARSEDGEHFIEGDRRVEPAAAHAARPPPSSIRTGTPAAAR